MSYCLIIHNRLGRACSSTSINNRILRASRILPNLRSGHIPYRVDDAVIGYRHDAFNIFFRPKPQRGYARTVPL